MIIGKPWGMEDILVKRDKYVVKRLSMLQGKRCSLQFHRKKTETVIIEGGSILYSEFKLPDRTPRKKYDEALSNFKKNPSLFLVEWILKRGNVLTIDPYTIHRMKGLENINTYLECSTTELDDVVRIEDDFGRV